MDLESDARKRLVYIVAHEESGVRTAGVEQPIGCPIREVYASCQYLRAMSSKVAVIPQSWMNVQSSAFAWSEGKCASH